MFVFVISNFMKSSTVYAASFCTFVRKRSEDNYKFGCRKRTLSDFLASRSSSLKKANTERPAEEVAKINLSSSLKSQDF